MRAAIRMMPEVTGFDVVQALAAGCDGYFAKPIDTRDEFPRAVARHVRGGSAG